MAELLGTDEFLVNRNDVTYTQQQETLMATLQDTDHLLINRAGQTYKITGSDLINSVVDPLEVTVVLAPTESYTDTEVTAVPVVSGGKQPDGGYIFTYQWVTADDPAGTNKTNIAGATNATFTPDNAQVGLFLGCVVSTTDALGTSAEGEAYIGPIQVLAQAPVIADVDITEIYDGQNRFTDKEFPYVTTMAVDGEPAPTYEVKAKLSGTTFDFSVKSDVITEVEGGGIAVCETDLIQSVDTTDYSTGGTVTGTPHPAAGTTVDVLFNGETSKNYGTSYGIASPNGATTVVVTFGKPIEVSESDIVKAAIFTNGGDVAAVNVTFEDDTFQNFTQTTVPVSNVSGTVLENSTIITHNGKNIKGLRFVGVGSSIIYVNGFYVNDTLVVDNNTVLTFPTNKGFDCFEPGYVVQGYSGKLKKTKLIRYGPDSTSGGGSSGGTNALYGLRFDGVPQTSFIPCTVRIWDGTTLTTVTDQNDPDMQGLFNPVEGPSATGNRTGFSVTAGVADSYIEIEFDEEIDAAKIEYIVNIDTWASINDGPMTPLGNTSNYLFVEMPSVGVAGAQVISKDEDANTIVVDGGSWAGSDGTGDVGDGRYEPSREWSAGETVTPEWRDFKKTFESAATGVGTYKAGAYGTGTIVFNPPLTGDIDVYVWVQGNQSSSSSSATFTDSAGNTETPTLEFTGTSGIGTAPQRVTLSDLKQIDLVSNNDTDGATLKAVAIGGKVLVDSSVSGAPGASKLVKETPYAAKLTVASSENLELLAAMADKSVFMTDASSVPATQTPYLLQTTDIESVSGSSDIYDGSGISVGGGGYAPLNMVNGDITSEVNTEQSYFRYTDLNPSNMSTYGVFFTGSSVFTVNSSLSLYLSRNQNNSGTEIYINGQATGVIFPGGQSLTPVKYDIPLDSFTLPLTVTQINAVFESGTPSNTGPAQYITGIEVDTKLMVAGEPFGTTTLTFPGDVSTNPDLQYFKAGDVVQKDFSPANGFSTGTPWSDGRSWEAFWEGRFNSSGVFAAAGETHTWNFTNPISGTLVITRASGQSVGSSTPWTFVENGIETKKYSADFSSNTLTMDVNNLESISVDTVSGTNAASVASMSLDGKDLYGTGSATSQDVAVISTGYPDSNTMVVDGGEWIGSDGSATDGADLGWNQDEVWSANTSGEYYGSTYTWTNVFDGVIGTTYTTGVYVKDGTTAQVDFNPPLACRKLELNSSKGVLTGDPLSGNIEVTVLTDGIQNTYTISPTVNTPSTVVWMEQLMPAKTVITSIKLGKSLNVNPGWGSTITAIKVDDRLLVDSGIAGAPTPVVDTHVEYQTNGGQGEVISVNTDDNTLLVTNSGDGDNRWIAENYGEGSGTSTDFYVAPASAVPITQDYAWGTLQIINDKAQVTGIQKDDPGFLPVPAKDYSIKFPAVFPTGNEPDSDIPRGACIAAIVAAENSEGRSVKESNCFMPLDVNPENAAGPITDSTPTQLTVASNANLGDFSPGDNLVMVDQDNKVSDYTMQTSEIENVEAALIEGIAQDNIVAQIGTAINIDSQGEITGYINNDQKLEAAGVTGITGFWVGYPGSNSSRFGSANTAGTQTFSLKGNWTGAGAGDIRDKVGIARTVGERYYSDNYSFETWWAKGSYPATGQPQGGVASTEMAEDDEIYGVIFDTPLTRSDATDDIDFRVLTYLDSNLATNEEIANSVSAIGIYDQNGDKVILYGRDDSKTELTFADPNPDLRYFRPGDMVQADAFVQDFTSAITGLIDPTYPGSKAFDGVVADGYSNGCKPQTGTTLVWDTSLLDAVPYGKSLKLHVYCGRYDSKQDNLLRVNDTFSFKATNDAVFDHVVPVDISVNGQPGPLNTVSWTYTAGGSNYCYLKGIEVDGQLLLDGTTSGASVVSTDFDNNKMIVDGGNWITSSAPNHEQDFVSNTTLDVEPPYEGSIENVFDDDETNYMYLVSTNYDNTHSFTTTFDPPLNGISLKYYRFPGGSYTYQINDEPAVNFDPTPDQTTIAELAASSTTVNKLTITQTNGGTDGGLYVYCLKSEGETLTQSDGGDTKVTYGPVTGTGTFQVADQLNNIMTIQNSNDRWIDNRNRLGIDFYVRDNITMLNADNPKHVAMQQAIADAFAAFPQKVNERRTAIASSFYRLMEGEALSAEEFGLLEETITGAVNASEPFALDGYYPLYYTSAKADAASSVGDHHVHNINGVNYYMPDGGTLYHGNYIAPETSTTDNNDSSY